MLREFLKVIFLIVIFVLGCGPGVVYEEAPLRTAFFLKGQKDIFLTQVNYFAEKGSIFSNDKCYSEIYFFKVRESGFQTLEELRIGGKCELHKSYFFNIIYPLSFPGNEFAITWWKGRMIGDPVEYSVRTTNQNIIDEKRLSVNRFYFEEGSILRFGSDLFYYFIKDNFAKIGSVSDNVDLNCNYSEKVKKTEIYISPVSEIPYYFAFVTDGVDVYKFSAKKVGDREYKCSFSPFVSVKGKFEKVFFSYPFFAGEQTTTSNSVDLDLINVENQKRIHYSFTFTSNTGSLDGDININITLRLAGIYPFKEGVLITFLRDVDVLGTDSPDHFISAWYFEDFKDSGSERRVNIKFPMGWFSLVRSFGGVTQYGDYIYAIGKLSSSFDLDDIEQHIFSGGNSCKSPWRKSYSIYRGGYNGKEFAWEKVGNVKFNCHLEW